MPDEVVSAAKRSILSVWIENVLGTTEPMFRFHTFVQTRLAGSPIAGTSTDGLVILRLIVNRSPLSLNTIEVICLMFHQLQGWRRSH